LRPSICEKLKAVKGTIFWSVCPRPSAVALAVSEAVSAQEVVGAEVVGAELVAHLAHELKDTEHRVYINMWIKHTI
jgi:hypothetical protein